MNSHLPTLRRRIAKAPELPGVYRWKDKDGTIIYVGKAKNLRNRLRSYVQKDAAKVAGPWRQSFYNLLADFDVTVTNSELEALVLETNLIKELRPKYNVLMKDDKNYVYIEIKTYEPFPTVHVERSMQDNKAKYFGPFLSAWETRQTLSMLNEIFQFRACKESLADLNRNGGDIVATAEKLRPCLDHQIGQCCGTCAGTVSGEVYRKKIDHIIHFLKGDFKPVLERGKELMHIAAAEKKFERAAKLRDMLLLIENMQERQLVSDTSGENVDIVGVALLSAKVHVVIFHKRNGKLIGEKHLQLVGYVESTGDALNQFLPQFYFDVADIPDALIVGEDFSDREQLSAFLSEKIGKNIPVIVPARGNKTKLLELAEKNAQEKAKQAEASWEAEKRNTEQALEELMATLNLPALPERIEGYDISHSGGTETVGSMVVTHLGKAKNEHYRSFTIRSMQRGAIDDYRALKEVLHRRLRHIAGGLSREQEQWEEQGVTIAKARKADGNAIEIIIQENADNLRQTEIDYKQFTVAREGEDIVAFARLFAHSTGLIELRSVWVSEHYRQSGLGQFLIRFVLQSVKKGKVYAVVHHALEQNYAMLGFRHVHKVPPVMRKSMEEESAAHPELKDAAVLMYDASEHKTDASLATTPDLLVIDGGKGQLNAVLEVLQQFNFSIPVIGLAKREEEVFIPGQSYPILFAKDSPAKFLLMRLRDEAHRFANRHRKKRVASALTESALDKALGIGPVKKKELMKVFGSVDAIRRASDEKLAEVLNEKEIAEVRRVL